MNSLATLGIKHIQNTVLPPIRDVNMETQEEIISKLKFIGYIQEDEKVDIRNMNLQPNNLVTKIYRTFLYPNDREGTYDFIKRTVERAIEIIEFNQDKDHLLCKIIISDLIKARQGINNLKYSYKDDKKFCCNLDVRIERIDSKLIYWKNQYPFLFVNESETSTSSVSNENI